MVEELISTKKLLLQSVIKAYNEGRRLATPLIGFPGLNITGSTIKLAQQNYGEHFNVIKTVVETFNPDAVFPLMDLSVEANALGRYTVFPKGESATVLKEEFTFDNLKAAGKINIQFDTRLLGYVETLKLMKAKLPKSVLRGAYVTAPYTLAGLLMGADEAAMATIMRPDELHEICKVTTEKILDYCKLLVKAGAQLICVLEPSAVMLGPEQFEQFSGKYVNQIVNNYIKSDVAIIYHICGNTMHLVEKMCESGVNALSLDSAEAGVDLCKVAKSIPEDIVIIGNLSPVGTLLFGQPQEVEKEVTHLLDMMKEFPNFILSTGCDLPQQTPIENIKAFMHAGKYYRIKSKI